MCMFGYRYFHSFVVKPFKFKFRFKTKTVNKHYETIATVMIDAGHGGYDGGTVAEDGTTEKI